MTILYAWVAPAFIQGSPADHTWVTSYDSRANVYSDIGQVVAAGENFWFCWGMYRPAGNPPPPIAQQPGDPVFASCLVAPNRESKPFPPARGTINTYGLNGVCHQLANQVLFATGAPGVAPATVVHARMYWLSSFLYGDYGRPVSAWQAKVASCRANVPGTGPGVDAMPDDMFEARLRAVIGEEDPRLDAVSALRDEHELAISQLALAEADADSAAAAMNQLNQSFFDRAADLLGEEDFGLVFGVPAYTRINLVDPDQLAAGLRPA